MPAGIVRSTIPTAVMPFSLSRSFVEVQTIPARVNEYHDGTSQRSAMLARARRSWQLAKHLPPALLAELRAFWQAQGIGGFYFYNPKETEPPFSYDPTGAATAGRYRVRFANAWSETAGVGLMDTAIQLVELFRGALALADDLAILIDRTTSLSAGDLANEKAAAAELVDAFAPLLNGGIAVYAHGPVARLIDVSHDEAAIKSVIAGIAFGSGTFVYDCIYAAATATTAKALVVMTDGDDNSSSHTMQQAIDACLAAGAKAYTIGFGNANASVLQQIASGTGGVFYPAATSENLAAIVQTLVEEVAQ